MKISLILIVLTFYIQIAEAQKYKEGQKAYSYAFSALKIRDIADIKGKLLDTIPYGGEFTVLPMSTAPVAFTVDGIPGHWIKVKYKNTAGFLFDGYSTRYPAPPKDVANLADYLKKHFSFRQEKVNLPDCKDCKSMITTNEGVKYIYKSDDEPSYNETIIEFPGMTIYEGFVFLLADHFEIRGLTLNQKFTESENEEKLKEFRKEIDWYIKPSQINTKITLVLVKSKADKVIKISLDFFYGAGYSTLSVEDLNGKGVKITSHSEAD